MDGTVSVPLIGSFKIQGKTIEQVNQLFIQEYARYLKRPLVTVTLLSQRPLQLAISGEVNNPGNYTINLTDEDRTNPTVSDLLEKAGGLTISADVTQIQLKRQENNIYRIYTLNFWELLQDGKLDQDVDLRDGDVVIVPTTNEINPDLIAPLIDASFGIKYKQAPTVTIVGEVNRPGSYSVPIEEGPPRITSVLQQSGGIKEFADIRNISVKRISRDGTYQNIKVDLWAMLSVDEANDVNKDLILKDGDTIVIPTANDVNPSEAQTLASANFSPNEIVVNVIGSLKAPGATKLPPNSPLNNAILAAGGFDERRANDEVVQLVRINPNGTVTKKEIKVDLAAGINENTNPILKNNDVVIVGRNTMTQITDGVETFLGPFGRTFSILNFFKLF
jgi:polysaccharide export outer membrane protein